MMLAKGQLSEKLALTVLSNIKEKEGVKLRTMLKQHYHSLKMKDLSR